MSTTAEVQAAQAPPSRRHWKVASSSAENSICAVVEVVVPDGPAVMLVTGAVASTDQAADSGVVSTLPAVSLARTSNVCGPSASAV